MICKSAGNARDCLHVSPYRDSAIEELALMYETLQNAGVELRE